MMRRNLGTHRDGDVFVSGKNSQAITTHPYATCTAVGLAAKAFATGPFSWVRAKHPRSIASAIGDSSSVFCGIGGMARVGRNGFMLFAHIDVTSHSDTPPYDRYIRGTVEDDIKPFTWYEVVDGKLSEVPAERCPAEVR